MKSNGAHSGHSKRGQEQKKQRRKLYRRTLLKSTAAGAGLFGLSGTATSQVDSDFIDILSADPSRYPSILLNVSVDTEAGREGRLTQEDFQITENGVRQAIQNFSFTSTTADVVFVFDDTGSMGDEIADMKAGVKGLTDDIESAGIDARYSLISFKDDIETDLELTKDATQLKSAVDELSADGGGDGPEDNFDALIRALGLDYRSGAQKIVVDITDSVSHYRGDGSEFSEYTIDEVASRLQTSGVAYIAVAPDPDDFPPDADDKFFEPQRSKKNLAEMIGGLWINIRSADFSRILTRIQRLVTTAYVLEYLTNTPVGGSREVGVGVNDPEEGTSRDVGSVTVGPDTGAGPVFTEMQNQKLALAEQITTISESISEQDRVQETLEGLETRVANGELGGGAAVQAIERMKFAENITETAIAGLSPKVTTTPENPNTLVGVPSDEPGGKDSYDIAGNTVQNVFSILVPLIIAGSKLAETAGVVGGKLLDSAQTYTSRTDDLISIIPFVAEEFRDEATSIASSLRNTIIEDGIEAGDAALDVLLGLIDDVKDEVSKVIVSGFEQDGSLGTSFDSKLIELDEQLDINSTDELSGTQTGAESAATGGLNSVRSVLKDTKESYDALENLADISGLLGGLATALTVASGGFALPYIGAAYAIVFSIVEIGLTVPNLFNTVDGLFDVRGEHNAAIDRIIAGSSEG